ncbi:MAG: DUF5615 family PIN-like protein [Pseudonocardia sp.]
MRLLIDESLQHELADVLSGHGHDAVHVADLGLQGAPDVEVLAKARADDRVVVTADTDFRTVSRSWTGTRFPTSGFGVQVPGGALLSRERSGPASRASADLFLDATVVVPAPGRSGTVPPGDHRGNLINGPASDPCPSRPGLERPPTAATISSRPRRPSGHRRGTPP